MLPMKTMLPGALRAIWLSWKLVHLNLQMRNDDREREGSRFSPSALPRT